MLCCSAFTSVHAYRLDWWKEKTERGTATAAVQYLGQRNTSFNSLDCSPSHRQPASEPLSSTALEHMRRRFSNCAPKKPSPICCCCRCW
ncbi:hypothetical protein ABVT39_000894 [Epinephelus coioides]